MTEVECLQRATNNSHTNCTNLREVVVGGEDEQCCRFRDFPAPCSYVKFLQQKEQEILMELHQEIELLKHENCDLKFQLYVAVKNADYRMESFNQTRNSFKIPNSRSYERVKALQDYDEDRDKELEQERLHVKKLQFELESATQMLEEARWIQLQYETRLHGQELKIEELQKQLHNLQTTAELEVIQLQIPQKQYQGSRPAFSKEYQPLRQRSSSITSNQLGDNQQRRGSHAILPDNYKETVATLPPIQGNGGGGGGSFNPSTSSNCNSGGSTVKLMKTRLNRLGSLGALSSSSTANGGTTTTTTTSGASSPALVATSTSKKKPS